MKDDHRTGTDEEFDVSCQELEFLMQAHHHDGLKELHETFGGLPSLEKRLQTNLITGLTGEPADLVRRRRVFGRNEILSKSAKSFLRLMFEAMQDVTLIILIVCAILSFALTFYPSEQPSFHDQFKHSKKNDRRALIDARPSRCRCLEETNVEWIESAAIILAVVVVIFVTAFNDWSKEKQFRGLQKKIELDQKFYLIRNNQLEQIQLRDIVVGDVCQVKYGDLLPVDGLVIQSNDLKTDESSLTGESDLVCKSAHKNPFLLSGSADSAQQRSRAR